MFKTVVAATDGSDQARKAVTMAAELAARSDARLLLLYVIGEGRLEPALRHMAEIEHLAEPLENETAPAPGPGIDPQQAREQARNARRIMQALAERTLAQARRASADAGATRIETAIEEGPPAERIVERARRENADLIVLGSRGLSDLKGLLLGSVSHKVGHLAPCSCITVR